jgi:hypothetical protein
VVNLGNDGWRSNESVVWLQQELKRQPPDYAVFVDSCNDVLTPFLYTGRVDLPWNFNKAWIAALVDSKQGSFGYLSGSNTAVMIRRMIRRIWPTPLRLLPADPDRTAQEIVDNYLKNIRAVDGLAKSYGFRYAFFWLPVPIEGQNPIFRVPVEKTRPLISAAAPGRFHDLTDAYDGRQDLVIDPCHVLPEGHKIVADRIYDTITSTPGRQPAAGE